MKNIKYWLIFFLLGILFPILTQAHERGGLDLDYFLYTQRKGKQTAMAYVGDLNERITKKDAEGDRSTFQYLTTILINVLTTGGPFGIRSTGPTKEELGTLDVSFQHVARLAVILRPNGQNKDVTLKSNVIGKMPDHTTVERTFSQAQAEGVYNRAFTFLETVSQKPLERKSWGANDWFGFDNGKVIIRDLRKGYEFYLLETIADGACWMHAMACSNDSEFTGKGFINKLLSLNEEERKEVCKFGIYPFNLKMPV